MILYFSATGNCKYVAERIADATNNKCMSIMDVINQKKYTLQIASDEVVGIVSPTYAWGIPTVIADFLQKVKFEFKGYPYFFYISTYGTTPGNSGYFANKYLKENAGIEFEAYYSIKMPDTWTPMFDLSNQEKVAKINKLVEPQIDEMIAHIHSRKTGNLMKNKVPRIAAAFYKPYYDNIRQTKNFHVEDGCIGCSLCEKKCPVNAIVMDNGKPVWTVERCAMCLGCLHRCPKFAIQYGKKTKKHGQYKNPHTRV